MEIEKFLFRQDQKIKRSDDCGLKIEREEAAVRQAAGDPGN